MHSLWARVSLTFVFSTSILAYERPPEAIINRRQTITSVTDPGSTAAATAVSPSATSTTVTPAEISEPFNVRGQGQIFPPPLQLEGLSTTDTTDFTINCIECHLNSDFSLSAGDSDAGVSFETPEDVAQRANGTFDFTDTWIAATIDNFNATFDLAFNLTKPSSRNQITIPIWSNTTTRQKQIDILTLSATLDVELHGWINSSLDFNFTYGFNYGIPPNSELVLDLSDMTSRSYGFNETSLTPLPFGATRGWIDVQMELSLRASLTFNASVGGDFVGASASGQVGLDVPRLDVNIGEVYQVDSNCNRETPSLPSDQSYENLTLITPSLGFDVFEDLTVQGHFLGADPARQLRPEQNSSRPLPTTCLFFDKAKQTLGVAPQVHPSQSEAKRSRAPVVAALSAALLVAMTLGGLLD
ncbi:MAG: hypothetical protein Q9162_006403 [Coniocarpon cinnabarinum]